MWFLRRKTGVAKIPAEVLPPAAVPMRRIEITVERRWISTAARSSPPETVEVLGVPDARLRLPKPPDG
jgi:hypothetical protein